jgi:hypothetical protein
MKKAALLIAGVTILAYFGCNPTVGEDDPVDYDSYPLVIEGEIDDWLVTFEGAYVYASYTKKGEWVDSALIDRYGTFKIGVPEVPEDIELDEQVANPTRCPDLFVATDSVYGMKEVQLFVADPKRPGDTVSLAFVPTLVEPAYNYEGIYSSPGYHYIYCDRVISIEAAGACRDPLFGGDVYYDVNVSYEEGYNIVKQEGLYVRRNDTTFGNSSKRSLEVLPMGKYRFSGEWLDENYYPFD